MEHVRDMPNLAGNPSIGNPTDGVRDLPDVSLFAANGVWGHAYVFCNSDPQRRR